jgi:hypothetical protein
MWTIGNFIRAFSFIMPAESRSDVRLAVVEAGGEPEGRALESVIRVFHRIECRRHGYPIRQLRDSSLVSIAIFLVV